MLGLPVGDAEGASEGEGVGRAVGALVGEALFGCEESFSEEKEEVQEMSQSESRIDRAEIICSRLLFCINTDKTHSYLGTSEGEWVGEEEGAALGLEVAVLVGAALGLLVGSVVGGIS